MMNRSKKVKMLSKCYTFLSFTACTILCTSFKDAKAIFITGRLGPRVSLLAKNFGGAISDKIKYGIVGGSTSGAADLSGVSGGGIRTVSTSIGGSGTGVNMGRGYGSGYHTGTGGGGFSSKLSGVRLASVPPKYPGGRDVTKLSLSGKAGSSGLTNLSVSSGGVGGLGTRNRHSTGIGGKGTGGSTGRVYSRGYYIGTGSSGNTQRTSLKLIIVENKGDGTRHIDIGN